MFKHSTNLKTITTIFFMTLLFLSLGCSKGDVPSTSASPAAEQAAGDTAAAEALLQKANAAKGEGKFEEADALYDQAQVADSENKEVAFMRACNYALWQKPEESIGSLQLAVDLGFSDTERLQGQVDLDTIRERDDYSLVEESVQENKDDQAADGGDGETEETPESSETPSETMEKTPEATESAPE